MLSLQEHSCCYLEPLGRSHMLAMAATGSQRKQDLAGEIRKWMLQVLEERPDLTATSWAKRAGLAGTTVSRAIKPTYEFVTSSRTLQKLAQEANVAPPEVTKARDLQVVPAHLPVRYRVRAGFWAEVEDYGEPIDRPQPVTPDPRYSEWPQWMELVEGDSANLKFPEGCYAHVVDAIEMGYAPRDGDWVIVERRRNGNGNMWQLRERTIKQVEIRNGRPTLWPRSTNPKWSEPVQLMLGAKDGEEIEVEIVGLVIGSYNPI